MSEPALLPANQMARRLRVTLRWLRAEAEAGRMPCVRAEKQLLFDADTVERVLLERARDPDFTHQVDPVAEPPKEAGDG